MNQPQKSNSNREPQESVASSIKYYKSLRVAPNDKKRITFDEEAKIHENMTVIQLKKIIADKLGHESSDSLKFLYGPNILTMNYDNKTLKEAKIDEDSTIFIVVRVHGGTDFITLFVRCLDNKTVPIYISKDRSIQTLKNTVHAKNGILSESLMNLKYYDTILANHKKINDYSFLKDQVTLIQNKVTLDQINDVKITHLKPDCISLDDSLDNYRALMPCGHAIGTDSMVYLLNNLVKQKGYLIRCPGLNILNKQCNSEWPFDLCKRVAVMTRDEKLEIEEGLAINYIQEGTLQAQECPQCKSQITREGIKENRVMCPFCIKKGKIVNFCWNCTRPWKNSMSKTLCGNFDCSTLDSINHILQTSIEKTISDVKVPETRACPLCYTLIDHINACKHMLCAGCKQQFCFICLGVKDSTGKWPCGSYNTGCKAAARQQLDDLKAK